MQIIEETQNSRNVVQIMEEGVIADQTPENYENDGHTLELDSPSSNKSVLVFEAWKQYRQQSTNL